MAQTSPRTTRRSSRRTLRFPTISARIVAARTERLVVSVMGGMTRGWTAGYFGSSKERSESPRVSCSLMFPGAIQTSAIGTPRLARTSIRTIASPIDGGGSTLPQQTLLCDLEHDRRLPRFRVTSSVNLEQPFPLEGNPFAIDAKSSEVFRMGEVEMSRVVLKTRSSRGLEPTILRRILQTHHRRLAPSARSSLRFP